MRPGELYLARFPFGDVPGMKLRPVLLLTGSLGSVPEALVAYISSVLPAQPLPSDLIVDPATTEFQGTHLKVRSALRLHKLARLAFIVRVYRDIWVGWNRLSTRSWRENSRRSWG
jgi:mRNA interferase MazF